MKKVGVVGVCIGGTSLFYPYFVRSAILKFNKTTPEVFLNQLPFDEVDNAFDQLSSGNQHVLADLILKSIEQLSHCNVNCAVIPNNAAHAVIDLVKQKSKIPVINLLDAIGEYCDANKFKKVLTLGSRWVMEKGLFQKSLETHGIESILLETSDILIIHNAIMNAMVSGSIDSKATEKIFKIIEKKQIESNCDAVIMACSDIAKILDQRDIGIIKVNTMFALADKTLSLLEAENHLR